MGPRDLILAAFSVSETSVISGVEHVDRGYEQIESKLVALGAQIHRIDAQTSLLAIRDVTNAATTRVSHVKAQFSGLSRAGSRSNSVHRTVQGRPDRD